MGGVGGPEDTAECEAVGGLGDVVCAAVPTEVNDPAFPDGKSPCLASFSDPVPPIGTESVVVFSAAWRFFRRISAAAAMPGVLVMSPGAADPASMERLESSGGSLDRPARVLSTDGGAGVPSELGENEGRSPDSSV